MRVTAKVAAVEFTGDEIRLAVIKTGRRPRLLESHACRAVYETPEARFGALVEAARTVAGRVKNRSAACVLCVSSLHSVVRVVSVPFRGQRKVQAAVPFELERYLAFPIEELAVDFFTMLEAEGQTEVLAVGVRRAVLEEQLAVLEAAGLDPDGADLDAVGLCSLWRVAHPAAKGLHAVFHVQDGNAVFAVMGPRSPVYLRSVAFSAAELDANPEPAIQEVMNSLRAFYAGWKGGGEVGSLTVSGAPLPEPVRDAFEKAFEFPVAFEDLLSRVQGLRGARFVSQEAPVEDAPPASGWDALAGAALGAAGAGYALNFRRDALAPRAPYRALVPHVVFSSVLATVLLLAVAWHYHAGHARNVDEIAALQQQADALDQEILDLQGQGLNIERAVLDDPNLLDILNEIGAKMPGTKAAITSIQIQPPAASGPWITIRGQVKDDAAFSAATADLKTSALFSIDEPELELEGGVATFKITAQRRGAAS